MSLNLKQKICLVAFILLSLTIEAQDRLLQLEKSLNEWSREISALNETVDISVSNVSVQDFLQGIAVNVNLNLSVDPSLNFDVINNFNGVKVVDVLIFLSREHNLEVTRTGNILRVTKYTPPVEKPLPPKKTYIIGYNGERDLLSIDVKNDTLSAVAREITNKSGKNVIIMPGYSDAMVKGYISEMPFDGALDKFAFANDFVIKKTNDNYYIFEKKNEKTQISSKSGKNNLTASSEEPSETEGMDFKISNFSSISVRANNVSVEKLIKTISDSLKINYAILSEIKDFTSLNLFNVSYNELLTHLLEGTKLRYIQKDNIYIIGDKSTLSVHQTDIIYLKHRTVAKITEILPADLKIDIEIIEFYELNCMFVSGYPAQVQSVREFIQNIDKPVPVILIEVMIVDIQKGHSISTGISAGFGKNPNESDNTILPGINYTFSTEEINNIFQKIDGLGWINLGNVSPDFYLTIKAMEDNNYLKIRSTPKLSTLNGHEATLTSGEVRYYKEERSNYYGSQNPALTNSYEWKPLNADLSISIKPMVSGDENITLSIKVSQAEFQTDNESEAPPGSITRGFESMIRVKNQEMILLGGIDKITDQDVSSGTPFLSRIPVIKWFFSSRTKAKKNSKMNIFIRPTIIY
jgi:type IV pilus assembly protein PilQ